MSVTASSTELNRIGATAWLESAAYEVAFGEHVSTWEKYFWELYDQRVLHRSTPDAALPQEVQDMPIWSDMSIWNGMCA